jgi:hypothetical protein
MDDTNKPREAVWETRLFDCRQLADGISTPPPPPLANTLIQNKIYKKRCSTIWLGTKVGSQDSVLSRDDRRAR